MLTHEEIKNRSRSCADVDTESDGLREALAFLDQLFKAHAKFVSREKERNQDDQLIGVDASEITRGP